ncbi:arginine N-succinyltransferase [Halomonas elongata]|uniref:Arginine N-succinyltransferase n=2 Tax=Halomonas elongata TaxID=2746 RepID=E1V6H0_HALED|nr:arginine N-succinyltransferase [Halomonas elongata]MBW5800909.1 arginine N-succinyltransferase [Halomonas elongata]OBX37963.1 arginine N-succinyltransferase subunit alpha [Halomonas elongata]WBF18535.1 arginine N-succinyltransferase [Halomonas elongata]WPU47389.1 arginine N-succinyltransferase [Halomonas elongata DSM 2581]WVI72058.1 arginine N-succinyltransferase [Halomonas elongata]
MLVVRPARPADLPALERLAGSATPRLTNLPAHRDRLEERLARSQRAFEAEVEFPGDEHYTFVLEDLERGEAVGTATIRAQAGAREAYYTYRQETLIHASQQLDVRREVQTLSLSHEVSEASLLCAYSLDAHYRGTSAESLLRRARLMFIAQYPERFAEILAMAFPGYLDDEQQSPFWNSVGRHFFVRDFQDINYIAGVRSKSFIAEVMPQFPLYQALLTPQARAAVGREHPEHESAMSEMLAEGFLRSRHVDIFDAGPVIKGERERLESFRHAAWHPVRIRPAHSLPDAEPAMVANQRLGDFRCVVARYALSPTGQLMLSPEHAELLGVEEGRAVLAAPLALAGAEHDPGYDEGEL